jgi:type I restriction enzyme S subunit
MSSNGKPAPTVTGFGMTPLSELCDQTRGITYGIVKVGEYIPNGVRVVRGGDVRNNCIRTDDTKRVTTEVSQRFKRTILRGGEIVLNLIAEPGHSAIVPRSLAGANVTRDIAVIPITKADPSFVNYFLQSPQCIRWLRAHLQGSVTLKINLGTLAQLPVPNPPIEEQHRVATILCAFDNKIESNRRLAALLDETIAVIFKARFVDFTGIEEFEERETERVPKGWKIGALNDLGRFINGKAFTKEANGRGRPILRIRELNSGIDDSTQRSDIETGEDHMASVGDILFAWSGSLGVYRWSGPESLINQHIFKVIPEDWPAWFVYGWIQEHMPEFQAIAQDKATTMGHIQRRHLAEAVVSIPDGEAIAATDDVVGWLDKHSRALVAEASTLQKLRDSLLSKLISGEMRVPDTTDPEEVIGPAADQLVGAAR